MTIDKAIEYYTNVATQRAIADEEKGNYEKWNETKFMTKKESEQIIADNCQTVEWLKELKNLREENKVLTSECDRLITKKGELLSKVSGGDVLRICQLENQLQVELDNNHCLEIELKEAKRLLKAAVEDMHIEDMCDVCVKRIPNSPIRCPDGSNCFVWRYKDEALKLIEG